MPRTRWPPQPGAGAGRTHLDGLAIVAAARLLPVLGLSAGAGQGHASRKCAPVFQAAHPIRGATLLLLLWCVMRGVRLFGATARCGRACSPAALFAAEFACLYMGPAVHERIAAHGISLHLAVLGRGCCCRSSCRSERMRPVQWLGLALAFAACGVRAARWLHRPAAAPMQLARRPAGDRGRHVLGPDHGGDPRHLAASAVGRKGVVLSSRGEQRGIAAAVARLWAKPGSGSSARSRPRRWCCRRRSARSPAISRGCGCWATIRPPRCRCSCF